MHTAILKRGSLFGLFSLLLMGLLVAGCDSGTDGGTTVRISGRVTSAQGYGGDDASNVKARQVADAGVEGAVVTAGRVNADGSTTGLTGEATTDAEGQFTFEVENPGNIVVLEATTGEDFESSVLLFINETPITAAPMTVESEVETDVFLSGIEDNSEGTPAPGLADVAVHVNGELAASVEADGATAADVASALSAAVLAEGTFVNQTQTAIDFNSAQQAQLLAFVELQANLAAGEGAEEAVHTFQEAVANTYVEAGASAEVQAHLRSAVRTALLESSSDLGAEAHFALRKQAEILTALATTQAIEAAFGESALADAGVTLIAELRAAASAEAIADAKAAYEAEVKAQAEAALGISSLIYTGARTTADVALNTALGAASSAEEIAEAYVTFFNDTTAEIVTALDEAGATDAETGASVVVLVSAFFSAG